MPLVEHFALPSFARLRQEGHEVLSVDRALHQDIRELHIGLLNIMPDAALQATERQFMRLIGGSNRIAQFYVHPFTIPGVSRQGAARMHVENFYKDFAAIQQDGLDALIITGANPANPDLTQEAFWPYLLEVMSWARNAVCSTLYSCLATHAAVNYYHGIERKRLPGKCWGVYSHRVIASRHPLVSNINTRFDGPHSHVYEVTRAQLENAGLTVLVDSEAAGVYLAVSEDLFRNIYFQGHPEYDAHSLLKEYKREVQRYVDGVHADYPPQPENYFNASAQVYLDAHREACIQARLKNTLAPEFPEQQLLACLDNTWTDTAKAVFNNWLGLVYQLTNHNRGKLFMEGIDPEDPLGLRKAAPSANEKSKQAAE